VTLIICPSCIMVPAERYGSAAFPVPLFKRHLFPFPLSLNRRTRMKYPVSLCPPALGIALPILSFTVIGPPSNDVSVPLLAQAVTKITSMPLSNFFACLNASYQRLPERHSFTPPSSLFISFNNPLGRSSPPKQELVRRPPSQ